MFEIEALRESLQASVDSVNLCVIYIHLGADNLFMRLPNSNAFVWYLRSDQIKLRMSCNEAELIELLVDAFAGKQDATNRLDRQAIARLRGKYLVKCRKSILVAFFDKLRSYGTVVPDPTAKGKTIKVLQKKKKQFLNSIESKMVQLPPVRNRLGFSVSTTNIPHCSPPTTTSGRHWTHTLRQQIDERPKRLGWSLPQ